MELKRLRETLQSLARVLDASGAAAQGKDVRRVTTLLEEASEPTVEAFVAHTKSAISDAHAAEEDARQPAEVVARRLREAEANSAAFNRWLDVVRGKATSKEKAVAIAKLYTGSSAIRTKPQAVKAIEERQRAKAFEASRARMNERVTPF